MVNFSQSALNRTIAVNVVKPSFLVIKLYLCNESRRLKSLAVVLVVKVFVLVEVGSMEGGVTKAASVLFFVMVYTLLIFNYFFLR